MDYDEHTTVEGGAMSAPALTAAVTQSSGAVSISLQDELLSPAAFPGAAPTVVERTQTHISWVFLLERDVYKVKRPVDFGFLDFRTLEKRRLACEAEVELNRRLTSNVYLGVVPIRRAADGRVAVNGPGEIVEWAVHMRRLSDGVRADILVKESKLSLEHLDAVAARLAEFHDQADRGPQVAAWGSPEHVAQNVRENFAQMRNTEQFISRREAAEIENWQHNWLRDHAVRFRERVERERVRDGHGDLRLEHVYFETGGIAVLDCIEFNDRFRYADVCADVAFLTMDLAAVGRADLSEFLLARYARYADDFDLYGLIDFYESYRALVRAKVASFAATDQTVASPARERACAEARRYALVALSAKRMPVTAPILVAVGGTIASGKSTVSDELGRAMAAPVVDTDRLRKRLAGRLPGDRVNAPLFNGAYSVEASEKVYDELFRRAGIVLRSGRPVVVEASFRTASQRARLRLLAKDHEVPLYLVECRAPVAVCKSRLAERARGASVSDGRIEIFEAFTKTFEEITEFAPTEHVVLDTTRALAENLEYLGRILGVADHAAFASSKYVLA